MKINQIITRLTFPMLVKKELKNLKKSGLTKNEMTIYIWRKYHEIADLKKNGIKQEDVAKIVERSRN